MSVNAPTSKVSVTISDALHLNSKDIINALLKKICDTFTHFRVDLLECSRTIKFRYHEEFFSAAMKEFVSRCARSLSLLQHFLEIETINNIGISLEQLETLILSGESLISHLWKEMEVLKNAIPSNQNIALVKRIRHSIKKRHAAAQKNAMLKLLLETVDILMKEQYPQDGMSSVNLLLSSVNQHTNDLSTTVNEAKALLATTSRDYWNK